MHPPVAYLFGSLGAALRAVPRTVGGGRAPRWHLETHVFGHVDIIVQQHLLLQACSRATGESSGGLSVPGLRQLLQAPPTAAPAVSLQASSRLNAATATVGGEEGCKWREGKCRMGRVRGGVYFDIIVLQHF